MMPGKKHSEEETENRVIADSFGLDDIVCVNGILGWLDFIGQEIIVVVDENHKRYWIEIKNIQSLVKYNAFIQGNMTNISIKELLTV